MRRCGIRFGFLAFSTFALFAAAVAPAAAQSIQSGTPVQFSLPAQNYISNYYVDVDASAKQLVITVNSASGADVDLFVRYGSPFPIGNSTTYPTSPQTVGEDTLNRWSQYHSFSLGSASETINVLPSNRVPLAAGRWYIAVINNDQNNTNSPTTTLTATVYSQPQVAAIAIDFNNPTQPDDTDTCDVAPWTDSTAVAPVGGNPGTTLGQQRQNALMYAVQQITTALQPPVPVTIRACWDHLGGTATRAVIANAAPVTFLVDEPYYGGYVLPRRYTWYSITEAVRQGGVQQCGLIALTCNQASDEEIKAVFNSDIGSASVIGGEKFYYGYTADTDSQSIDFVSVAMHELTHGMGFIGLANTDSTLGPIGAKAGIDASNTVNYQNLTEGPYDDIYDVQAVMLDPNNTSQYTPFMGYEVNGSGDAARASALVSNNLLRWGEATAVDSSVNALKNQPTPQNFPLLYAPNPISNGSTLSHTYQSGDLMYPQYPFPPPRTLGLSAPMLAPLGWGNAAMAAPTYGQPFPSNWYDRTHSGHGIDLQLARRDPVYGDVYILVFYTYDANGNPEWYLANGNVIDGVFVGSLDSNGSSLGYSTYGPNRGVGQLSITPQSSVYGNVVVDFNQAANAAVCRNADRSGATMLGVLSWTIGPSADQSSWVHRDWCIEPIVTLAQRATPDYTGHWYAPNDSYWGMEVLNYDGNSASSSIFVLLYYPDQSGLPTWGVAAGTVDNGVANLQLLERTNGYCRTCSPPASQTTSPIGTMKLTFAAPASNTVAATGTATFTVNYPGGGTFSRTNQPITTISLPPGK